MLSGLTTIKKKNLVKPIIILKAKCSQFIFKFLYVGRKFTLNVLFGY